MENNKNGKVSITQKEIDEIYDIIPNIEDTKDIPEEKKEEDLEGVSKADQEYMRNYDKETISPMADEEIEDALSEV